MYEKVFENTTYQIFTDLLSVPNPTAREHLVAEKIIGYAKEWGYQPEQDYSGNVVVRVKGNGKSERVVMTSSHMDEIGLVITGINKDGTLRIHKLGGTLPWKIGERPVEILTDKGTTIVGITSFGAGHSQVGRNEVSWDQLVITTGYTPEQLKELGVRVGSVAVPAMNFRGPTVFGHPDDPMIGAWVYDDRMGCAFQLTVLKLLKEKKLQPNCDWTFAFSKQEEVKGNGIKQLTVREQPDVLIAVDGGPFFHGQDVTWEGGPVIFTKDKLADYSLDVILAFQAAAKDAGTELQYTVTDVAYTDASLALQSGGPLQIGYMGYTKGNSHGYELMKYSMLNTYLDLFLSLIKTYVP